MNHYNGLNINMNLPTKKRLIFSLFFILQNKMQTLFDNQWDEITSKQWLILIISNAFPNPPSLTEVAQHAGCSRQNVKKIVAVLEKKGFVKLVTEKKTRAVRIVLTQKFHDFYEPFLEKSSWGINNLFEGMTDDEIETFFTLLNKLRNNVDHWTDKLYPIDSKEK